MAWGRAEQDSGGTALLDPEVLARLGLPADAGEDDVEALRERIRAFLATAPPDLEPWVAVQAGWVETEVTPAAARVAGVEHQDEDEDDDQDADEERDATEVRTTNRRPGRRASLGRPLAWLGPVGLMLAVAALVLGVYQIGGTEQPTRTGDQTSTQAATLDQAAVVELMSRLDADPSDVAARRTLADLYFQAGDFASAASWHQTIVDIDPTDVDARLALGVALFNSGDTAGARKQWVKVTRLDPAQVEAHYNLGFLFLSTYPPDIERARAEWAKVVELDGDSELARTVATHLQQLDGRSSPSPGSPSDRGG